MFERVLQRLRQLVESGEYVMSLHAQEEMESDGMTAFDVESCILTGSVVERQKDRRTGEWKYLIQGRSLSDIECVVVGKVTPTGKLGILTVFVVIG